MSFWERETKIEAARLAAFEQVKDGLVVKARVLTQEFPMQIIGIVDGRSFYLAAQVLLAPESNPMTFVNDTPDFAGASVVAEGTEAELFGSGPEHYVGALRVAVSAVRTQLGAATS